MKWDRDLVELSRKILLGKKKKLVEGVKIRTYLAFWLQEVLIPISAGQYWGRQDGMHRPPTRMAGHGRQHPTSSPCSSPRAPVQTACLRSLLKQHLPGQASLARNWEPAQCWGPSPAPLFTVSMALLTFRYVVSFSDAHIPEGPLHAQHLEQDLE